MKLLVFLDDCGHFNIYPLIDLNTYVKREIALELKKSSFDEVLDADDLKLFNVLEYLNDEDFISLVLKMSGRGRLEILDIEALYTRSNS